tara:strand:+ start:11 stop:523 length:513 start_codon:yes stop_codon:yes gene_type:complete
MSQFDPYVALGLAYGVTDAEIKTQYRKLVKELHPDRNKHPNARQQFEHVVEAYKLLSNPIEKAKFDAQRQRDLFGIPEESSFFSGLKNFASKLAHDFIDNVSHEEDQIDASIYDLCDISTKQTSRSINLNIRIPRDNLDLFVEDDEYWIEQVCLSIAKNIRNASGKKRDQ